MQIDDVQVRSFSKSDVNGFLAYWYDNDPNFFSALGLNPVRLPRRKKMLELLEVNIRRDALGDREVNPLIAIALHGVTIGAHELTHLQPTKKTHGVAFQSGVMHAHIWRPEHRGHGIALISYVKAMRLYFDRFGLEAINFETPIHNLGANRIKQKLGLVAVGEGLFHWPLFEEPLRTLRYFVTPADMPFIERRMRQCWLERAHR